MRSRPARRVLVLVAVLTWVVSCTPVTATAASGGRGERQVAVVSARGDVEAREVSDEEAATLEQRNAVVRRGRSAGPALSRSVPMVGAPPYWGLGHRGAGKVIVVIDTGVGHGGSGEPGTSTFDFGGTLVGQACFAATQLPEGLDGHCGKRRDVTEAFDDTCFDLGICTNGTDEKDAEAARPCEEAVSVRACAHGTAVAAVAARHEPTPGVAPDAGVYAIQVFDPTGSRADFVDILLALDHVGDLAEAGMDVAAANLSLSSADTFSTACDLGPAPDPDAIALRAAMLRLAGQGIPTVVATGNAGDGSAIGLPACVAAAVAVGASDLSDRLADFGNRGPLVDLVAPGAADQTGRQGLEIPGTPVSEWSGTSFSAPHVSGAFALVEAEYPKALLQHGFAHLQRTAARAVDPWTGGTYPRLRLLPPDQALPVGVLFPASAAVAGTARGRIGDFDGDGFDDVLAHAPGSALDRIAYGTTKWALDAKTFQVSGTYVPIVGQLRGSAADDILWYAAGTAADSLWVGSTARSFAKSPVSIRGTYTPLVGDFDGDRYDDILWYAPGTAADSVWYGGPSGFTVRAASITGTYRVVVGDVNGDGRDDLLFHGPGTASDSLWRGTATKGVWARSSLTMNGSFVMRAGDFDGDGDADVLLYQSGTAADAIWRGGPSVGGTGGAGGFSPLSVTVSGSFQPSVADLDGDGRDDILWYAPGPAVDAVWFGRPTGAPTTRSLSVSGTYTPLFGDLDADAGADIVWFQGRTAETPVWWSHTG